MREATENNKPYLNDLNKRRWGNTEPYKINRNGRNYCTTFKNNSEHELPQFTNQKGIDHQNALKTESL